MVEQTGTATTVADGGYERWHFFYRWRGWLMVPIMALALVITGRELEHDKLVFGLGGSVFGAGLCLRVWAQAHLRYRLRVHKVLTITGPFAYVRNPIYIANTVLLVGLAFMSEVVWLAPVVATWCAVVYSLVVRYEEGNLRRQYKDAYVRYCESVPRWRPRRRLVSHVVPSRPIGVRILALSLVAEAHNVLLCLPYVLKEIVSSR